MISQRSYQKILFQRKSPRLLFNSRKKRLLSPRSIVFLMKSTERSSNISINSFTNCLMMREKNGAILENSFSSIARKPSKIISKGLTRKNPWVVKRRNRKIPARQQKRRKNLRKNRGLNRSQKIMFPMVICQITSTLKSSKSSSSFKTFQRLLIGLASSKKKEQSTLLPRPETRTARKKNWRFRNEFLLINLAKRFLPKILQIVKG